MDFQLPVQPMNTINSLLVSRFVLHSSALVDDELYAVVDM